MNLKTILSQSNLILTLLMIFFSVQSFSAVFKQDSILFKIFEVQLDSGLEAIYGTLTIPVVKEKIPVALIISGSGPTDRDGNNPFGLNTDCYKLLAGSLAQYKIASLRFDKRGVAKSTPALESERILSIGTYVDDAEKWVKFLRKDQRFSKVIIIGHSEGALIGTLVSNFQRADGFISISGAGLRADSLIIDQISKQSASLGDTAKAIIEHIKKNEPFYVNKDLQAIFRPNVLRYLKSWFALSPVIEISILRCPVMIMQGAADIQVSIEEAKLLAKAKPGAKLIIIDKMNHVLKNASHDRSENLATYKDPSLPLAHELVPAISDFIAGLK